MVTRRNRVDSDIVPEKEYPTEVTLVRVHGSVAGLAVTAWRSHT